MTVEDQRSENDVSLDRFPAGMRVLAVDDDPICLKILETLLRKCQYEVTTTNQAIKALKMLRDNKTMFDLVISDVNMPDMDGFKLLEHVGLEMDLPVIMLSAHSDTKLVMKGITHGACDYLLKPVRIEELKNIWQHVVRRMKSSQTKSLGVETRVGGNEVGPVDQNTKFNRKRKDQDEDDEEESEDDGHENDDPTSQKKPRIVWTTELHKKFVDAVQQLGYDKAFPKKILDLMNHEGLTRENVASHLQKYRQFLKRLDNAERQKANGLLGVKDFSYMRMNHNEFADLRALTQPVRLGNNSLSPSVSHVGLLGRLNSPTGLSMRGMASNGIGQPNNSLTLSNSFNTLGKFQTSMPASHTQGLFHGFPSLELNKFQQLQKTTSSNLIGELNNMLNGSTPTTGFTAFAGFQGNKTTLGSSSGVPDSPSTQNLMFGNGALLMTEPNRCNEPWQSTVQSSHSQLHPDNRMIPSASSQFGNSLVGFPSTSSVTKSRGDDGLIGNIVPSNNFTPMQTWEGGFDNNNNNFCTLNNVCDKSNSTMFGQFDGSSMPTFPSTEIEKSGAKTNAAMPNELNILEQGKAQDELIPNSYESLDDILNSLMKRDRNDTTSLMNGEFEFDNFPLSSCM